MADIKTLEKVISGHSGAAVWVIFKEGKPVGVSEKAPTLVADFNVWAERYVPAEAAGRQGAEAPWELPPPELVAQLTEAMRAADQAFERVGGSTRHHVRECLIPELERAGLALVKADQLAPVARWVPQSERMPPVGVTVIVLRRNEAEPIAAQLDDDGDWVDSATHEVRGVTHWMPLPSKPGGPT